MWVNAIGHMILSSQSYHTLLEAFNLELGHEIKNKGVDQTIVQCRHEKTLEGWGCSVIEVL